MLLYRKHEVAQQGSRLQKSSHRDGREAFSLRPLRGGEKRASRPSVANAIPQLVNASGLFSMIVRPPSP